MKRNDIKILVQWVLVIVLVFLASGIVENPISRVVRVVVSGQMTISDIQKAWTKPVSPKADVPTMSATGVCQYVNQALSNKYVYRIPTLRYEYRYTALSAQYIGESAWEVSVRETVEYQRLYEGQWTLFSGSTPPVSQTVKYIFNEVTAAVSQK